MRAPRYRAREARGATDRAAVLRLRALAFHGDAARDDAEAGDDRCTHFVVEAASGGAPLCAFRTMLLPGGHAIDNSFAAQVYDLKRLSGFTAPMVELGRFCLHPAVRDPDILRLAWATLAQQVDRNGVALLFGCASFAGTDPAAHAPALALLSAHAAPARWAPGRRAPEAVALLPTVGADGGGASRVADGGGAPPVADGGGAPRVADGGGAPRVADGGGAPRVAEGGGAPRVAEGGGAPRVAEGAEAMPEAAGTDPRAGLKAMPPLLRAYLGMGAWFSDHAVIDRAMETLHVFCGVETARIPLHRKRALRALAASD